MVSVAAARVAGRSQALQGIVRDFVLRIACDPSVQVSATWPGPHEAGKLIDMAAGLVEIHALAQPDHAADAEIAAQLLLDLGRG